MPYRTRVAAEGAGGWTENRPTAGARALDLRELWHYRELLFFLALRDVKARYKQAFFGVAWSVLQPFAGVAVFTIVFRRLAHVPSDGIPYAVFALLGFTVWTYFSASLGAATQSLVSNASLVTKVYFARLVAPLAALLPALIGLAVGLILVAALMAGYAIAPGVEVLALPLCLLGLMAAALGPGLLFGAINVKYRDVGTVLGLLTQLWLFASPVAYPSTLVGGTWRYVYAINPMAGVIDSFRWSLLGAPAPGPRLLVSLATGAALLAVGLWTFQRTERQFADVI
jgi:ABC-type polysaccharide/polyol phosphate export permease